LLLAIAGMAAAAALASSAARDPGALSGALRALLTFAAAGAIGLFGAALGAGAAGPRAVAGGAALEFFALAAMALLAPLHAWGGAALSRAPALVAALFVAVISPAALWSLGAHVGAAPTTAIALILAALGAVSAALGSVQALAARRPARLAGYAFTAGAGCAAMSLAVGGEAGAAGAGLQMIAAAIAAGLIAAAAPAAQTFGLAGLSRRAPVSAAALALGLLVAMGAPLTIGFAGRWAIVEAAMDKGWWWAAALTVGAGLAAVVYGGRALEPMFFRAPPDEPQDARAPALAGVGLAVVTVAVASLGLLAGPVAEVAGKAGAALAGAP
jgi:multicomponent Na+:H+ antiporter subunit D